jgi:hypothetical protein
VSGFATVLMNMIVRRVAGLREAGNSQTENAY